MFKETPEDTNERLKTAVYHARQLRIALYSATWGVFDSDFFLRGQIEAMAQEADSLSSRIEHTRRVWNKHGRRAANG